MRIASAAITMNASTQTDIPPPQPLQTCTTVRFRRSGNLRFAPVGLLARFDGRADRGAYGVFLARHDFLAAFDQVFGPFAEFTCFLLCILAALVCLAAQIVARLLTGFRGKQYSNQRADSQSYDEETHLTSSVLSHVRLQFFDSSIAFKDRQVMHCQYCGALSGFPGIVFL